MQTILQQISNHYRTGQSDLGKDFFLPCLQNCIQYRRSVGYFSSGALITWSEAIPYLLNKNAVIKLIISPELSREDKDALKKAIDETQSYHLRQIIADEIIKDALQLKTDSQSIYLRQKILAWMIANEKIIVKFAFPQHIEQSGIFHEKIGIFDFCDGESIAFTGSANESINGHHRNYESIDVYRSYVEEDRDRIRIKIEMFEETWSDQTIGLQVLSLSEKTINFVKSYAPADLPYKSRQDISSSQMGLSNSNQVLQNGDYKWQHQEIAVQKFLAIGHGILEMATGTGKTRTTLKILNCLDEQDRIDGIIISTVGIDLLEQWSKEIYTWSIHRPQIFRVLKHYGSNHQLESFLNNPQRAAIVISREQLDLLFKRLDSNIKHRLIIVHDEVHGLGSPAIRKKLTGKHQDFGYRLGLSATPEREYDRDGTQFIFDELGDIFFQFDLREAIEREILCPFDYIPLYYELTANDKSRLHQVYKRKDARKKAGNPMTKEEVWIELSKVYKTAEEKPAIFAHFLEKDPRILKSTIIFVDNQNYGRKILEIIHRYTHRYRTYYSGEDRRHLKEFMRGNIDCLITCHRLSQGIDSKKIENVILFSSARAKLETIQRIGRCLRIDPDNPNKRAKVVDFVLESQDRKNMSADEERYHWLSQLARIKK
jgi:superfamily II DNA or RNA helicase